MSKIKYISFLYKNERVIIKSNASGKFRVPLSSGGKTIYKELSAQEVIKLREIKNGDPVITTISGEKLRIFQGGDPTYLPAMADGLLRKHDSQFIVSKKSRADLHRSSRDYDQPAFDWMDDDWGF